MRYAGLTLCLLASSLGARAESVEDRVAALEARVKALEATLQAQTAKAATVANINGSYKATLPNGEALTVEFADGKAVATTASGAKAATYEIVGQRVIVTPESGKQEILTIVDADHLRSEGRDKVEFVKTK